ncbi:OLC1v1027159C1 [Oldenlandia corymbosa var. corymbosa]|uniref:OLC1v1027159C1 n=1 Tax=Oldenlandia corymbosa var. corymbosa TaxID=529605 RepID=A0AAV1C8U1_OLDCO|nr:OLC1v1027159C1 [Oldenlandia corymbosa var. corymbosa]
MRRALGGGSGSSGMGGGSGGSIQMLRSVQRAVRASAAQEPFSHSGAASSTGGRSGRKSSTTAIYAGNKGPNLTISSSSTSSPIHPPISVTSTAWPSSPTFSDDSFDWVSVEDDGAQVVYDDYIFGAVPSKEEVQHAVVALKEVLEPGSPTYFSMDRSVNMLDGEVVDNITSPTGSNEVVSPFGSKLDWVEPPYQLWSSSVLQARGYDRVHDAFSLLRNEPSVQRMVMSLSSDRAVWDAVLNNEVVQELRGSFNPDMSRSEKSDDGDNDTSNVAKSFMEWIVINTKAKVKEFIEKITKIVNELLHTEEDEKTANKTPDPFEDKLRASFFLSVVVMLIVVVARTKA